MSAAISIDLDFWGSAPYVQGVGKFVAKLLNLGLPIYCAVHHHHIIEWVNEHPCDKLINIDTHSDLSDRDPSLILNEGTWANFVEWAPGATFEWGHPQGTVGTHNFCHGAVNPFETNNTNWQTVTKKRGLRNLPWGDISAVAVCVSPDWIDNRVYIEPAIRLLNLYEIIGREWADPGSRHTCIR